MKNYFFDFLPNDIQYFIHQIVLSNYIVRNYFTKAQQKKRLIKEISLYNEYSKLPTTMEYLRYGGDSYLDPYNKKVSKFLYNASNILTHEDINEQTWWLISLIRPVERGFVFNNFFPDTLYNNRTFDIEKYDLSNENYEKSLKYYSIIIDIIGATKNKLIFNLLINE
tara:strand:+ start:2187 stop:2687 length:501 start_codon:yes stop_codon:yes gene_type:complete